MSQLRGLLLLLSRLLLVYQPISLALVASNALNELAVRGASLVVAIVIRIAVTGVCIAAGLALTNRHPGAIALARIALILSALCDLFVYGTSYFPTNMVPGDAPLYIGASLLYHGAWLLYLARSRAAADLAG